MHREADCNGYARISPEGSEPSCQLLSFSPNSKYMDPYDLKYTNSRHSEYMESLDYMLQTIPRKCLEGNSAKWHLLVPKN
jgi:hypothetical protein